MHFSTALSLQRTALAYLFFFINPFTTIQFSYQHMVRPTGGSHRGEWVNKDYFLCIIDEADQEKIRKDYFI